MTTPTRASDRLTAAIETGFKVPRSLLTRALTVDIPAEKRNDRGWPARFVCGQITGPEFDGGSTAVGVWAIGDSDESPGPVFALDSVAREWSVWGEAANPGSPAMALIERLAGYDEARQLRDAVKALTDES